MARLRVPDRPLQGTWVTDWSCQPHTSAAIVLTGDPAHAFGGARLLKGLDLDDLDQTYPQPDGYKKFS